MKLISYVLFSIFILQQTILHSFAVFGQEKIIDDLKGAKVDLPTTIEEYTEYLLLFLYILAVVYGIYGGFLILTAADDDDKVKKGKAVILRAIIGLIVIFAAGSIAALFIGNENAILTQ